MMLYIAALDNIGELSKNIITKRLCVVSLHNYLRKRRHFKKMDKVTHNQIYISEFTKHEN